MTFHPCPKPTKREKPKKPISRKAKFHDYQNPFKSYHQRHTEQEILGYGESCRQARLEGPTDAEQKFEEILKESEIKYEREKIFYQRDQTGRLLGFVIADFYFDNAKLIVEIDGNYHNLRKGYDRGRDRYFEESGIKTIRFINKEVIKKTQAVLTLIKNRLSNPSPKPSFP